MKRLTCFEKQKPVYRTVIVSDGKRSEEFVILNESAWNPKKAFKERIKARKVMGLR